MDWTRETPEEKAKRIGVPVIPPRKPVRPESNPTLGVCGACGIEVKKIMGLACRRDDCPLNSHTFL